jgi:L,D-transpeptidase YcbB
MKRHRHAPGSNGPAVHAVSNAARHRKRREGAGRAPWIGRAAVLVVLAQAGPLAAQGTVSDAIEVRIEALKSTSRLTIGDDHVRAASAVADVYEANAFRPLWPTPSPRRLLGAVRSLEKHGLRSGYYHTDELASLIVDEDTVATAQRDILMTDAFVLAIHDLRYGHANAAYPFDPGASLETLTGLLAGQIANIAGADDPAAALDAFRPHHFSYDELIRSLAQLREISSNGGWPTIPAGPTLHRDSSDARVPILRRRLIVEGYTAIDANDAAFDSTLEATVRAFQHRHGLNEDGVVGEGTLAQLNVPVDARIDQVRVNLERGRWLLHDLPDTVVLVNIAGAKVYLLYGDSVAFETRTVVGKTYTKTPVFGATLRYVELNPYWTVPPGIVGEVLAQVRKSRSYLEREGMRVIDSGGRIVDATTLDFDSWTAHTFPYVFRQDPGPLNPLGRIKFVLPNDHDVYLHDTPARELFEQEKRTFSHGCIRVQNPLALATLVLDDSAWNPRSLEDAIETGRTMRLRPRAPMPVLIQYWTASTDPHGELHFYSDVYGRDGRVLADLDAT